MLFFTTLAISHRRHHTRPCSTNAVSTVTVTETITQTPVPTTSPSATPSPGFEITLTTPIADILNYLVTNGDAGLIVLENFCQTTNTGPQLQSVLDYIGINLALTVPELCVYLNTSPTETPQASPTSFPGTPIGTETEAESPSEIPTESPVESPMESPTETPQASPVVTEDILTTVLNRYNLGFILAALTPEQVTIVQSALANYCATGDLTITGNVSAEIQTILAYIEANVNFEVILRDICNSATPTVPPTVPPTVSPTASPTTSPTVSPSATPTSTQVVTNGTTLANIFITYYGYTDNSCETEEETNCNLVAFPEIQPYTQENQGTYANPNTLATDPRLITPGTIVYVPKWQKYYIMTDSCFECAQDYDNNQNRIDLFIGPSTPPVHPDNLIACENQLTVEGYIDEVIINPQNDLPVNTQVLFDDVVNTCN